jgi:NTE family protein
MITTRKIKSDFMRLLRNDKQKNVALVLSSGGARGLAHVGAIEALLERGYTISSIAGTSFGAIVGGMYAAGHLDDFKRFMASMDKRRILQLSDFSFGVDHLMKGMRIIKEMQTFMPDVNIEDLKIPFCCVATNWKTGREVVFDHGSLWTAIRSSMSVPGMLKPLVHDDMILIDGGITNPIPLDRVKRNDGDLLVAINVSGHDYEGMFARKEIAEKLQRKNSIGMDLLGYLLPKELGLGINLYSLLDQAFSISINANAHRAIKLYPPDVLVDIPMRRYGGNDYDKYAAIRKIGYNKTLKAIDAWAERRQHATISLPFKKRQAKGEG